MRKNSRNFRFHPVTMIHEITSVSNPKIKDIVKLRTTRHRRETGLTLIDGARETYWAMDGTIEIVSIYAKESRIDALRKLLGEQSRIALYLVSDKVFEKIAFGNRKDGILAVARTPERSLENFDKTLQKTDNPLIAVLEGVEKPGNVGAMLRSADGAGLDGAVMADGRCEVFSPSTIRCSMGTIFRLPTAEGQATEVLNRLRQRKIGMAVARCEGGIPYTDYDFRKPTAIVMGSEADGLTDLWHGDDVQAVTLPMLGFADSLNVSVAAAVLFYEARRQRDCLTQRR